MALGLFDLSPSEMEELYLFAARQPFDNAERLRTLLRIYEARTDADSADLEETLDEYEGAVGAAQPHLRDADAKLEEIDAALETQLEAIDRALRTRFTGKGARENRAEHFHTTLKAALMDLKALKKDLKAAADHVSRARGDLDL
jgi:hypothetical protein